MDSISQVSIFAFNVKYKFDLSKTEWATKEEKNTNYLLEEPFPNVIERDDIIKQIYCLYQTNNKNHNNEKTHADSWSKWNTQVWISLIPLVS